MRFEEETIVIIGTFYCVVYSHSFKQLAVLNQSSLLKKPRHFQVWDDSSTAMCLQPLATAQP
jgi:hypothetical protein